MLQYETASAAVVSPRRPSGVGDVTVTSSLGPAAGSKQQSSSPGNQLRVQVSAPDDTTNSNQYSTAVVAETNQGNYDSVHGD